MDQARGNCAGFARGVPGVQERTAAARTRPKSRGVGEHGAATAGQDRGTSMCPPPRGSYLLSAATRAPCNVPLSCLAAPPRGLRRGLCVNRPQSVNSSCKRKQPTQQDSKAQHRRGHLGVQTQHPGPRARSPTGGRGGPGATSCSTAGAGRQRVLSTVGTLLPPASPCPQQDPRTPLPAAPTLPPTPPASAVPTVGVQGGGGPAGWGCRRVWFGGSPLPPGRGVPRTKGGETIAGENGSPKAGSTKG